MTTYVSAVLWLIFSPIAVFSDIFAIFIICHYRPYHHGTDLTLISLMVSMAVNAILVIPLPAALHLGDFRWTSDMCNFYVWAFITFRIVQLLNLAVLSGHWAAILKFSVIKKHVNTTTFIKWILPLSWMIAGIVGILPILGVAEGMSFDNISCTVLSYNVGLGFGIFFGIFIIMCLLVAMLCACDSMIILKSVRKVALVKYGAGRFYLPKKRSQIPGQETFTVHERYNQLTISWDLCKLATVVTIFSFGINHLPYAVIQFFQITSRHNKNILEELVLWLILVEALILPHVLWISSKRYRHALVYICKVHICRNKQDEEDPSTCTLQSYVKKSKDLNGRATVVRDRIINDQNAPVSQINSLERQNGGATSSTKMSPEMYPRNHTSIHKHKNGVIRTNHNDNSQGITTATIENHKPVRSPDSSQTRGHDIPLNTLSVQISNSKTLQIKAPDLKRTSSACSRKEWKDQMIRKHLPAIFVNEAFDREENIKQLQQASIRQRDIAEDDRSLHSLHYYVSSDYHPDYLNTDSLHRKKTPRQESDKSESEGLSGQYDEVDIEHILDKYRGESFDSGQKTIIRQENIQETDIDEDLSGYRNYDKSADHSDRGNEENGEFLENHHRMYKTRLEKRNGSGSYSSTSHYYTDSSPTPTVDIEVQETKNDDKVLDQSVVDKGNNVCIPDIDTHYLMTEYSTDKVSEEYENQLRYSNIPDIIPKASQTTTNGLTFQNEYTLPKGNNSFKIDNKVAVNMNSNESEKDKSDSELADTDVEASHNEHMLHERWLDMNRPLLDSSDVDTLQSSHDSRIASITFENANMSSRNSPTVFDTEVDKGFEEALSVEQYQPGFDTSSVMNSNSIKEESECSFGSQEMLSEDGEFKTHAVVSKSRSASRSSSSSENPFDMAPTLSSFMTDRHNRFRNNEPIYANCNVTSVTSADALGSDTGSFGARGSSPWPESDPEVLNTELQFESNFETPLPSGIESNRKRNTKTEQQSSDTIGTTFTDVQPVYF